MAAVEKLSIALGHEEVRWAKSEARKRKTSVSRVVADAIRKERQAAARRKLFEELGVDDLSPTQIEKIEREWRGLQK
jgi:hypothetical protein